MQVKKYITKLPFNIIFADLTSKFFSDFSLFKPQIFILFFAADQKNLIHICHMEIKRLMVFGKMNVGCVS